MDFDFKILAKKNPADRNGSHNHYWKVIRYSG